MWNHLDQMQSESLATIRQALHRGYLTIANDLQREQIKNLDQLSGRLEECKRDAQKRLDEPVANMAFILQCYVRSVHDFLLMWIHLKANKLMKAWHSLVDAQNWYYQGVRLDEFPGFTSYTAQLSVAEKLLFPPQKFLSAGMQFEWSECSICGKRYGEECLDHLAGRLYMGELCVRICHELLPDHVAIVDHPDDKALLFIQDVSTFTGKVSRPTLKTNKKKRKGKR